MHVLIANYGNESMALIAWAMQQGLEKASVLSVDTGWAAQGWDKRVSLGESLAERAGFQAVRLKPTLQFTELMQDRGEFPTIKFQWCAGILKGLPILDWLDEQDPHCEATVVLSSRRAASKGFRYLEEHVEESEHYGDRAVWHPLVDYSDAARDELLASIEVEKLPHRSLECDPCVNSAESDFRRLQQADIAKTESLEQALERPMFVDKQRQYSDICALCAGARQQLEQAEQGTRFDMGCGAPYACGQ